VLCSIPAVTQTRRTVGELGWQGADACWQSACLSQELPGLSLKLLPQPMLCSVVGSCSDSLVAAFLLFKHCILRNILPSCWMLHLVLLALMLCYHQFNTSCAALKEERLYVIHVHLFFSL